MNLFIADGLGKVGPLRRLTSNRNARANRRWQEIGRIESLTSVSLGFPSKTLKEAHTDFNR